MSDDMIRADPRLRRKTLIALAVAAVVAVIAVIIFQRWLGEISAISGTDLLILRLRRMIGIGLTGSAICLALLAWYAAHQASRTKAAGRWPLPDARVMRDTVIRRGTAARSLAQLLQLTAVVLLVLAFAMGYFSLQMLNTA
ncbi:hypothetical protein [Dokdonella sp.]|uniref:hypothetical protein n=1 Tax=Dokdonella sp. TaxID=2291710 RepID=UPI003C3247D9